MHIPGRCRDWPMGAQYRVFAAIVQSLGMGNSRTVDELAKDQLVKLVEDVRCNRFMNIAKGKVIPESYP